MEESLDEKFKPDVKEAWQSTFDALSGDMIASQKQYKKNKK
jgi:hypothetical protein